MKRILFWALELVAGAVLGALIFQAVALYFTGYRAVIYEIAKLAGYSAGVSVGVYGLGRMLGQPGSFLFALIGALIGGFLARLVTAGDTIEGIVQLIRSALLTVAILGPILATLGFNIGLSRNKPE